MRDLDGATRGLTATLAELSVKSADGKQVCDTGRLSFIAGEGPATVGPSLWRMERLNSAAVLLRVTESTDQICGHDLANVNLVECKAGRPAGAIGKRPKRIEGVAQELNVLHDCKYTRSCISAITTSGRGPAAVKPSSGPVPH